MLHLKLISLPQEQSYVCLEIADSGCGIEEKDIDKIFDPFFSTKFIGRGLGLSVVLGIARAHEAAITVESRLGTGSVFRVFFPLQTQMT
ncbi:MAG: ATP-binding protein [Lentisphaerota bacterium]